MNEPDFVMSALAEIGAMRRVLVQALALKLMEEPSPVHALAILDHQLTRTATTPPADTGLDPAISDMLAAMTDERIGALVGDLKRVLGGMAGPV